MSTFEAEVIKDLALHVATNRGAEWFPEEANAKVAAILDDTTTPGPERFRQLLELIEEHTDKKDVSRWLRSR